MWKAQTVNVFGQIVSDYTPNQLSLINITKEYNNVFESIAKSVCSKCERRKSGCHDTCSHWPKQEMLENYYWLKKWWSNWKPKEPKKKYSQGWV